MMPMMMVFMIIVMMVDEMLMGWTAVLMMQMLQCWIASVAAR